VLLNIAYICIKRQKKDGGKESRDKKEKRMNGGGIT
jgi:hypothetical protein